MNIKDFTDRFSVSAVTKEDGLVVIKGKYGTIQEDINNFIVSVNSEFKTLSTTRRRKILNELHYNDLATNEDIDSEELMFSITEEDVDLVAELIQVRKKRQLSQETKDKLRERLAGG